MIETIVFIIGVVIFSIVVYGSVMAGGLALTRAELAQNPQFAEGVDSVELKKTLPHVKY